MRHLISWQLSALLSLQWRRTLWTIPIRVVSRPAARPQIVQRRPAPVRTQCHRNEVCGAGPLQAASVEAYGRLPSIDNVSVSPEWREIAFVQNIGDKRLLRVMSVRDGKLAGGVDLDGQRMRRLEWADNKNLLITTSYSGAPPMVVTQLIGEVRELTLLNTATHKYIVFAELEAGFLPYAFGRNRSVSGTSAEWSHGVIPRPSPRHPAYRPGFGCASGCVAYVL